MIVTVPPKSGWRYNNHAQVQYETAFAARFKELEHLPNYPTLEQFAQQCIDLHCGDSLHGISARIYMDKIIAMSNEEIFDWAKSVSRPATATM